MDTLGNTVDNRTQDVDFLLQLSKIITSKLGTLPLERYAFITDPVEINKFINQIIKDVRDGYTKRKFESIPFFFEPNYYTMTIEKTKAVFSYVFARCNYIAEYENLSTGSLLQSQQRQSGRLTQRQSGRRLQQRPSGRFLQQQEAKAMKTALQRANLLQNQQQSQYQTQNKELERALQQTKASQKLYPDKSSPVVMQEQQTQQAIKGKLLQKKAQQTNQKQQKDQTVSRINNVQSIIDQYGQGKSLPKNQSSLQKIPDGGMESQESLRKIIDRMEELVKKGKAT